MELRIGLVVDRQLSPLALVCVVVWVSMICAFSRGFRRCTSVPAVYFKRPTNIVVCSWRPMSTLNPAENDFKELFYIAQSLVSNPRSLVMVHPFLKSLQDAARPATVRFDAKLRRDIYTHVMDGMEQMCGPGVITWPPYSCYGLCLYTRHSKDICLQTVHNATWEILQMSGVQQATAAFTVFGWRWFPGRVVLSLLGQAPQHMQIPDLKELADRATAASKIWNVYPVAPEFWTAATSFGECWERGVSIVNLFPGDVSYADSEGHNSRHIGAVRFAAVLNDATATIPSDKHLVIIRPAKGEAFEGLVFVKNATGDWSAAIECYQPLSDTVQLELSAFISAKQPWKPVQHLTDALAGLQAVGTALSPVTSALASSRYTYVRLTPNIFTGDPPPDSGVLLPRKSTIAALLGMEDQYDVFRRRWDLEHAGW